MFKFDRTDLQRFAISAVGALALSTASILAAVGPARAAEIPAAATAAPVAVAPAAR